MIETFPIEYTLESGTHVTVDKRDDRTFEFKLRPTEEPANGFTYIQDDRSKSEWDDKLEFEQLEALRKFWLKNEDIV